MQAKHEDRFLFLKQFTKELILHSKPSEIFKKKEKPLPSIEVLVSLPQPEEELSKTEKPVLVKPFTKPYIKPTKPFLFPQPKYKLKPLVPAGFETSIKPITEKPIMQFQKLPATPELNLGKLNFLIKDPRVTIIECPGPGKIVTLITSGTTKLTNLSLSQEEIQNIIETFSKAAKIPVISGLFKAVIGNLVMTAVISELAGTRFIITKITPKFILEQESKNY